MTKIMKPFLYKRVSTKSVTPSIPVYSKQLTTRREVSWFLWLLASLTFYLAFAVADGPVLCVDSQSYISMDYSREPLYPLFLAMLRAVIGKAPSRYGADIPRYLVVAVFIQAVVTAIGVWYFVRIIVELGEENSPFVSHDRITKAILFVTCWGTDLLNRFVARRSSMYMESIMTESLAIPLFLIFLACVFEYFRKHSALRLLACLFLMAALISTRKQMAVSAVILVGFSFLYDLMHRRWKAFAACVFAALIAIGSATLAEYSYNYVLRGVLMHKTGNYKGTVCTLLYTARPQDEELFDDPEVRELFVSIYGVCRARGLTWEDYTDAYTDKGRQNASATAPDPRNNLPEPEIEVIERDVLTATDVATGWIGRTDHFSESYDEIGYEVMLPILKEKVLKDNPDIDGIHLALRVDKYMKELQDGLVRQNPSRFIQLFGMNMLEGLSNTILKKTPLLSSVAFCILGVYIVTMLILWQRYRKRSYPPVLLLAAIVLFSVFANCATVGAVIFPQTRYMIYNMAPFYCSGILMLTECRNSIN